MKNEFTSHLAAKREIESDQAFSVDDADEEAIFDPIRDDFMTIHKPPMQSIFNDLNFDPKNSHDARAKKQLMKQQMRKRMSKRLQDFAGLAADL